VNLRLRLPDDTAVPRTPGQSGALRRRIAHLWLALTWWRARRRLPATAEDVARLDFHQQLRGRGLRMTEWLRDRLRPGWLRMRREEER
jgi:hypothetical protein